MEDGQQEKGTEYHAHTLDLIDHGSLLTSAH